MPSRKKDHAHRSGDEDGNVVCACGKTFDDDAAWRDHYESETTEEERVRLEGREDRVDDDAASE